MGLDHLENTRLSVSDNYKKISFDNDVQAAGIAKLIDSCIGF